MGYNNFCFFSKNTSISSSPLAAKGPCRSSSCGVYSPSGNPTKIRKIRINPYYSNVSNIYTQTNTPNFQYCLIWCFNYRIYLHTSTSYKISYCILFSWPYRTSNSRPNVMFILRLIRFFSTNNCTWFMLFMLICYSKLVL